MKNVPITSEVVKKLPKGFHVTTSAPSRRHKVEMARELKLMKREAWKYTQTIRPHYVWKKNDWVDIGSKKIIHKSPIKKIHGI